MCAELLSVEPDCKWALLTSAALAPLRARLAGAPGGAAEAAAEEAAAAAVRRAAAALARVDAARSVYYADLASAAALRAAVARALAAGAPHADPAVSARPANRCDIQLWFQPRRHEPLVAASLRRPAPSSPPTSLLAGGRRVRRAERRARGAGRGRGRCGWRACR